MTADDIIALLDLAPHPEGGWFRQTWVEDPASGTPDGGTRRPSGTCIWFLLRPGERSHWHRVDAAEIWHHYLGGPVELSLSETAEGPARQHVLGPDLVAGERPQIIVPAGWWQAARPLSGHALTGCTVSPGFRFEGFELAPQGFGIPAGPAPRA